MSSPRRVRIDRITVRSKEQAGAGGGDALQEALTTEIASRLGGTLGTAGGAETVGTVAAQTAEQVAAAVRRARGRS